MLTIGRKDRIDLPELGYKNLKVKIDTGAFGNVLHCTNIEIIEQEGSEMLSFILLDPGHPKFRPERQYFKDFKDKLVKNSSGGTEHRYIIETLTVFCGEKVRANFSLTDRNQMKYPILLGRKFLKGRFLVDVNLKDISYNLKRKQ